MRANVATVATTHPIGTHLILCEGDPRNFLAKNRRPPPEKAYSFSGGGRRLMERNFRGAAWYKIDGSSGFRCKTSQSGHPVNLSF